MRYVSLLEHEGKRSELAKTGRIHINNHHSVSIVRRILESGTWYSKRRYHCAKKDGNNDQGIVGLGGFVSPARSLSVEGRCGSGMYNLEVVYK